MGKDKGALRICLLSYRGNPYCGGQGIYLKYVAEELVSLGHQVHVLVGPPYPFMMDGAVLHPVPNQLYFGYPTSAIFQRSPVGALVSPLNAYEYLSSRLGVFPEIRAFSFRAFFQLGRLLREQRFDVIHDNQCLGYGFLLMKRFGIPLISTIHHPLSIDRRTWFEQPSTLKQKIKMILYYPLYMQSFVAKRMDAIVTVSRDSSLQIQKDFGVPAHKIRVVYNGVDTGLFRPLPDEQKVPNRIIFVGNVADRKKGVLFLLKAMDYLPAEVQLVIVDGGTPARVSTWELIKHFQLQGRAWVTGKVDTEDLIRLYSTAQLAVIPSLYEGFGFPAAEAMACALPVVATTAGALPEVVGENGRAGLLVEPRDPKGLAAAIKELLQSPQRCLEMGNEGRQRIINLFSWKRAAQQLTEVYLEALDAHR